MEFKHEPVLLKECIEALNIKTDGIYVDGTLGGAGHSYEIVKKLSPKGLLIGIDRDSEALKAAKEKLKDYTNVKYVHDNHDNIKQILEELQINGVDGILLDLGVSSYQLDEKNRGFSYMADAELDMRMNKEQELTAKQVINSYSEEDLANIIWEYGEEKFSRQIAKNICNVRKQKTIEIKPLYNTILDCINCLNKNGRLAVLTFHSLEDRAVKKAYKEAEGNCTCPSDLPYCVCGAKSLGKIINKKPIEATREETERNTRSKSAKLRIFEKR